MKKLAAFWLAIVLILCSVCITGAVDTNTEALLGDSDNNGVIEVTDATYIQRYVAELIELSEAAISASDVDGDGNVTVMDCTSIQQFVAKMIDRFPAHVEPTTATEIATDSYLGDFVSGTVIVTETEPTEKETQPDDGSPNEYELEVLRLVNVERKKAGVAPLEFGYFYYECAKLRAEECASIDNFSHTRPNGSKWNTVFAECNIKLPSGYKIGENIAWGHIDAYDVMYDEYGWMNSPGHRANILKPEFKYVAIGSAQCVEQPGTYATSQLFWG